MHIMTNAIMVESVDKDFFFHTVKTHRKTATSVQFIMIIMIIIMIIIAVNMDCSLCNLHFV